MAILQNTTVSGSLVVTGDLTARQFILSSSVTFFTESFASGSTRFGDSMDDTMVVTGSLRLTGSGTFSDRLTAGGTVQITGAGSPTTGAGLEMGYGNFTAGRTTITSYNRTGAAYVGNDYNALDYIWYTSGGQKMTLTNAGAVGIGTTVPLNVLDVRQASATMGNYQTIQAFSTDSAAINLGGGISLGGYFTSTTSIAQFASIVGRKENSTSANYDGYLAFGTNAQATGVVERMRITSAGNVGIGTTNPNISGGSAGSTVLTISATQSARNGILELNGTRTNATDIVTYIRFYNNAAASPLSEIRTLRRASDTAGELLIYTSNSERLRVSDIGNTFGVIEASDANSKIALDVVNQTCGAIPAPSGTTLYLYSRSGGTNYRATLTSSTYFTGQHGNKPTNQDLKTNIQNYIGLIVRSVGTYYSVNPITQAVTTGKDAITISESLPEIELVSTDKDKAVWGVVTNVKNDNYNTDGTTEFDNDPQFGDRLGENVIRVNGLGEGAVWVTNINGNIENGDYICSSTIPGYGRKQDDDLLHNYTVAKSTMDCDFDLNNDNLYVCEEFEYEGQTYKKAFIGCTYHCS
jgi:hypothetical protein